MVLEKLIQNIQVLKQKKQEEQVLPNNNEDFEHYLHNSSEVLNQNKNNINQNKNNINEINFKKSPINANLIEISTSKNPIKSQFNSSKKQPLKTQKTNSHNHEQEAESKDEKVIKSLYVDRNNENLNTNKCKNCYEIEKKLLKSEQKNVNLMFENKKLKDALNNAANIQQNLLQSCKKIFNIIFFKKNILILLILQKFRVSNKSK